MKYFVDTEFIEDGKTIDLISIGIVSEDGREYYEQSCEFIAQYASDWVKEHVFPSLTLCPITASGSLGQNLLEHFTPGQCRTWSTSKGVHGPLCPWRHRNALRYELLRFFGEEPVEFVMWCGAYDFVALCQLFGEMMDVPKNWPHSFIELQTMLDDRGLHDEDLPPQEGTVHNALADARYTKQLYDWIQRGDQATTEITPEQIQRQVLKNITNILQAGPSFGKGVL